MGVKERRDRERQELKQSILEAAREIAAAEGWPAVTIRRVAEKIEYTPPTIYEYFEDKDAILEAEAQEGFRLLVGDLEAARDAHSEPLDQLRAMGRAYWDFVWKHPELYQVISGLGGVPFCEPGKPHEEGGQVSALFEQVLAGILPPSRRTPEVLASKILIMWSIFHGFIALLMAGRIPMEARDQSVGLAVQAIEELLTVWQAA